ncbi:R-phenyllactate dehydratase activator [Caloramator mitchellensis]|uniref:R-phenyllactate dehydratase activator n=1 Tax=Caloramator mitchellensis TaxID=908809 RepID=A0A0R3JSN2_CALMK|nr:acyl-CoA dehydratase activase [Caloramator mitchellensis]KRQ86519.1 R-phenyllactate dehydratase activator [Caloramator mitchellensis]
MFYIGIDMGSTASKITVFKEDEIFYNFVMPTGWNSKETAILIENRLKEIDVDYCNAKIVATGYGRVSVPYAHKTVTEISCHGKGVHYLTGEDLTVVDIGGQDTKIIELKGGQVKSFLMNDKCAAGTGRFLELMANTLGLSLEEMFSFAKMGEAVAISSMCTVFAESEIISLIGNGIKRENICAGVVESVVNKVYTMIQKSSPFDKYFLSGGLCQNELIIEKLKKKLGKQVYSHKLGRYAGSIGAALFAKNFR